MCRCIMWQTHGRTWLAQDVVHDQECPCRHLSQELWLFPYSWHHRQVDGDGEDDDHDDDN